MKKNYIDIPLGKWKMLSVHKRDASKNSIIINMLPKAPATLFEASAGHAQLAQILQYMGYKISISNYDTIDEDIPFPQMKLDLNKQKEEPLKGAPFDGIICREVIEHVENVPHVLRLFQKNLTDNGTLILTFPNRLVFRSRLYYLLTGFYRGMPSPINLSYYMGEEHINLTGYPEMDYFLRKTGYSIESVKTSEINPLDYIWLLVWPFIWIITSYFILIHKKNREGHEKNSMEEINKNKFIRNRLLSIDLFLGKDVIIKAKKQGNTLQ